MIETDPVPLSDADEELFQQVRNHLLGKVPPPETVPLVVAAITPRRNAGRWLWVGAGILVLVTAVATVATRVFDNLNPVLPLLILCIAVGSLIGLAIVAAAVVLARFLVRALTPKRPERPIGSPPLPAPAAPWRNFLITLVLFALLAALAFRLDEVAVLIGVLLLHELGHFLGMRYFGYRDVQMFFIPLFGAAVRGEKKGVPAWQETIVLLLGPVPGLLLGCAIYFVDFFLLDPAEPHSLLRMAAGMLVVINFLNLLPFEPLDGGRICNRLLFSRLRWLEAVTVVLATVGLIFVCLQPSWICLALSAAFALFVLAPARYKMATAGMALQARWPEMPAEFADLSEAQWRDLFCSTRERFPKADPKKLAANPKLLADQMKIIHQRALQRPESGPVTLALFSVYLAAIALGVVTASVTHLQDDAGRWPIRRHVKDLTDPAPAPIAPKNNGEPGA